MKTTSRLLPTAIAIAGSILFLLLLRSPATPHEGEKHGETTAEATRTEPNPIGVPAKEAQLFAKKLRKPEYVHVLLNPIPVYGSAFGAVALATALILKSKRAMFSGMLVVMLSTGAAWPVFWYGQRAYDQISLSLRPDAAQWLDLHMERAEMFIYVFLLTALLAVAGMVTWRRWPKAMTAFAVATLVGAVACAGLGAWIGHAGGQVMHSEFREGPPPAPSPH